MADSELYALDSGELTLEPSPEVEGSRQPMPAETREKIAESMRHQSTEAKENRARALRGKKRTSAQKKRMSEARLVLHIKLSPEDIANRTAVRRKNGWFKHPEKTKRKMSLNNKRARLGVTESVETITKKSVALMGERNPNWQGGITPVNARIRKTFRYRLWRTAVFLRDDYTCQMCTRRGGKLNADHIKPFAQYLDLRFELDNGRTLCVPCHRKTDTWGHSKRHRATT